MLLKEFTCSCDVPSNTVLCIVTVAFIAAAAQNNTEFSVFHLL